jgi:hypothetical protein
LLDHVSSIDERTSMVIVTQLCLALADLVLVMPEWPRAVDELIQVQYTPFGFHVLLSTSKSPTVKMSAKLPLKIITHIHAENKFCLIGRTALVACGIMGR